MSELRDAISGAEVRVDSSTIEQTLAELWRIEKTDGEAVTRAALWNVVAHAVTPRDHTHASDVLGKAAIIVPQRTIVVRADLAGPSEMASWISANCHMLGEGKQVCSEEISIVAGGDHVDRVPPLVNALLIPDMPVAFWWVGDMPHEHPAYVRALLESADRLIVDSVHFDSIEDLEIVKISSERTGTAPADLNWIRLEEWRAAAASAFDPPEMRGRLQTLRQIRIVTGALDIEYFGETIQAMLFASWLLAQAGIEVDESGCATNVDIELEVRRAQGQCLIRVDLELDGSSVAIERDAERGVLLVDVDGHVAMPQAVTRASTRNDEQLIVRELQQPQSDRLLLKVLPLAIRLARRK